MLLDQLELYKTTFGKPSAQRVSGLLKRLGSARFKHPGELIRLHETTLFLRAFPQSPPVARLCDEILLAFEDRLRGVDTGVFDDPKISGIAGTAVSTNFSYEFARSLVQRHGEAVSIDWESYERPERLGPVLARLLPMAQELYAVEPHVDWRAWFEKSRRSLPWLLENVDPLTYELLEIPIRWKLSARSSRSGLRLERRDLFCRTGPFLKRAEVSLEAEFAAPPIRARRLSSTEAQLVEAAIIDASAARYRELHGFQHPPRNVYHADLGRGVDLYFFGVAEKQQLPLRDYHCGMFFTNAVPTGYVEALSLKGHAQIGFNLYYTFRDGETAWVFARILKLIREQVGVDSFSIDPYQLGDNNDEAIESGAFWFYRKLGFDPANEEIVRLVAREEARIARDGAYRSSRAVLRKLAEVPLFYGGGFYATKL